MKSGAGLTLFLVCTTLISGMLAAFYLWRLKRQQSALAMREQTYRSLAENLPDSVIRWDVAGRCLYVNALHERIVAMSAADLIGKTVSETFPEGQFALIETALSQVITTGKAVLLVRFAVQVNDETKFHDINLIPERDASGQLVSVLCIGRDMTNLYHLQDDLVVREREFRSLADSSPGMMGSFYSRPDGSICMPYVSPNIEKLFGLRPQDVAHDASVLFALHHPEDAQRIDESIAESARSMTTWHEEFRVLHPTLGERWMESNTNPEPHPQGGIIWYGYVHDITARKQVEQRMALIERAIDLSSEVILLVDEHLRFNYVNATACRVLGYDQETLLTMGPADIDADITHEQALEMMQTKPFDGMFTFESHHRAKDGRLFPVEVSASHFNDGGRMLSLCIVRDITERRLQQQASLTVRQENEQRMLNYFENAPGFFYTLVRRSDGRYAITFASPGISELFGIEPQAVMQSISAYLAVVHPDDVEMSIRLMEQTECALTRFQLEYRINHPGKGLRWMEVHAVPQRLLDGGTCWNGFIYDITDRKHLEDQLAQREQEFRSLAESSPDSIIRYDLDHRILYLNDLLVRDLELASDNEVIGKRPIEVWPDGRFAVIDEAAKRVIASGTTESIELVWTRDHCIARVGHIVVVPERDMTGRIIGTLAFGRDITAIREAERKLAHFLDNLPGLAYTFHLSPEGRGCFPYVSNAIEDIYGLNAEDVKDDMAALHALAHPEDQARIEAAIAESLLTMRPFQMESRVCRPGLPERWIDVRSVPEHQPDDSILWYGIMLDITERKQAELEREAFRTQLRGMAARQDKVREEERRHIAREVHDELGQILSALKLNTFVLARKFAQDVPGLRAHLAQTAVLTDKALSVARNIASALRPVALDLGFVPALESLAECFENNTGTPVEIHTHSKDIKLKEQYAIALFRIVQEALTNITRHAQAQRVTIELKKDGGDDVLIVRDDGTGFDPRIRKENSFGLVGMQERALMLGGALSINSRTGGGTEIMVRIPAQVAENVA